MMSAQSWTALSVPVSTEAPGILVQHNKLSQVNLAAIVQEFGRKTDKTTLHLPLLYLFIRKVENKSQAPQ